MTTEIESLACAEKAYWRAKPVGRWGAAQSHVVIESVTCALSTSGTARQGVATGGGVLVSLSTWQVASSIRRGARATTRRTPRLGVRALRNPRLVQVRPTTSP